MRLISFQSSSGPSYGALTNAGVVDLKVVVGDRFPDLKSVIHAGALDTLSASLGEAPLFANEGEVDFLPVIPNPGKILCIGLNYESHRKETGRDKTQYPAVFTRFADTQTGHGKPIIMPRVSTSLDYEGELAVIIGKGGRYIDASDAMSHVAGYSCYNDATLRDFQRHTIQFTAGKNFPDTGPFGPCLVTADEISDVHSLSIQTRLNGDIMQDANTSKLIFNIPALIAYLSSFTPLSPGDVIATGTPGGVGFKRDPQVFMKPGDTVEVEIESVGLLRNTIKAE